LPKGNAGGLKDESGMIFINQVVELIDYLQDLALAPVV